MISPANNTGLSFISGLGRVRIGGLLPMVMQDMPLRDIIILHRERLSQRWTVNSVQGSPERKVFKAQLQPETQDCATEAWQAVVSWQGLRHGFQLL